MTANQNHLGGLLKKLNCHNQDFDSAGWSGVPGDSNKGSVRKQREEISELGFQEDRIEGEMPPAATSEGNQETLGHGPWPLELGNLWSFTVQCILQDSMTWNSSDLGSYSDLGFT